MTTRTDLHGTFFWRQISRDDTHRHRYHSPDSFARRSSGFWNVNRLPAEKPSSLASKNPGREYKSITASYTSGGPPPRYDVCRHLR